jgi:hypothetical protein
VAKHDKERAGKIRIAVRYLMEQGCLENGNQKALADYYHVSRQRVSQIKREEDLKTEVRRMLRSGESYGSITQWVEELGKRFRGVKNIRQIIKAEVDIYFAELSQQIKTNKQAS